MKREKVKFYLKKNKKETSLIMASFHFNYVADGRNIPFRYSTSIKIPTDAWDAIEQRIKIGYKGINDISGKNYRLDDIASSIELNHRRLNLMGEEITITKLKAALKNEVLGKPKPIITLLGFMENFMKTCDRNPQTVKNYGSTIRVLKDYCRVYKYHLDFDTVDMVFYKSFVKWCKSVSKKINTIGGYIKHVKMFMAEAEEEGLHNNMVYKSKKFITLQEQVDTIYLNETELRFLIDLDLSFSKLYEAVRDFFIIGAYSGLRVSDWKNLSISNFKDDGSFSIKVIKTKKSVTIPQQHIIQEILKRNCGNVPRAYCGNYYNINLRKIGIIALQAYDKLVSEGKPVRNIDKSKFLKFRTHTARRSFCTNAFLSGMAPADIMLCSGHKSEKNFYKYIRMTEEEGKNKIKDFPFFTGVGSNLKKKPFLENNITKELINYSLN